MSTYRVRKFLAGVFASKVSSAEQKADVQRMVMRINDAEANKLFDELLEKASAETRMKLAALRNES